MGHPVSRSHLSSLAARTGYLAGVVVRRAMDLLNLARSALRGLIDRGPLESTRCLEPGTGARPLLAVPGRSTSRRGTRPRAAADPGKAHEGKATGLAPVAAALSDPSPLVRQRAAEVLGELGGEGVAELVVEALHDPEPGVRHAAASSAGQARVREAVFSLILLLQDEDPRVCQEAQNAIEAITGRPVDLPTDQMVVERSEKLDELKAWWTWQRLTQLAGRGGEDQGL